MSSSNSKKYWLFGLAAIFGGLFNRIRGGGFGKFRQSLKDLVPSWLTWLFDGKYVNAMAFGLFIGFLAGDWKLGLFSLAAMFIGQAPGWGEYIGAAGGWRKGIHFLPVGTQLSDYKIDSDLYKLYKPLDEWDPIDFIIKPLLKYPVAWGVVGLTLRGALWGACLSIALQSAIPLAASLLMGVVYFSLTRYSRKWGWEYSEIVFGIILWISSTGAVLL